MPEIPEIETVRRLLHQHTTGKTVAEIAVEREKTLNVSSAELTNHLHHATVQDVLRRGKIIIMQFTSPEHSTSPVWLLFHFMLDGYLKFLLPTEEMEKNYQLMLQFTTGERLYFCKMYLGYIHLETTPSLEQVPEIAELGPDPLAPEFSAANFFALLHKRRTMIKPLLMDQNFLAGIGNTYSNEGLFLAGILPKRKANSLSEAESSKLHHELRAVLQRSIELGGVNDMTFSTADRLTGGFIPELKVSYREGQPCYVCGTPIAFLKVNGRNAFFCPVCQR